MIKKGTLLVIGISLLRLIQDTREMHTTVTLTSTSSYLIPSICSRIELCHIKKHLVTKFKTFLVRFIIGKFFHRDVISCLIIAVFIYGMHLNNLLVL